MQLFNVFRMTNKKKCILLLCFATVFTATIAQETTKVRDITYFCTDWGRKVSWDEFCKWVAEAGFDGVETRVPASDAAQQEMMAAFQKYGLSYIFLCSSGSGTDLAAHLAGYKRTLERAAALRPVRINSHTGKDHVGRGQNEQFLALADSISRATGVPIVHETHRGRFSFAAHITKEYLERLPYVKLALDISHWCAVHESMLGDQSAAVDLALQRTDHIHARIGHPEGPQVNDPRAPEWENIVQQHLEWWDVIVASHREQRQPLTITMEFGPPDYLPTLPYARQPIADQWAINKYMFNLLKSRYNN